MDVACPLLFVQYQTMATTPKGSVVKLNSRNQLAFPKEAREALSANPGGELLVSVKGDTVILIRKPDDMVRDLAGSEKDVYRPAEQYIRRERRSW